MCKINVGCEKPEDLKGKPEECTPEQIKKCHGRREVSKSAPATHWLYFLKKRTNFRNLPGCVQPS